RVLDPEAQIFWCVPGCAGRDRVTTHHVREIGTKAASAVRALDCVAIHASGRLENASPRGFAVALCARKLLRAYPFVKIGLSLHGRLQKHLRMLRAAILRALAEICSGFLRRDPHFIDAIRNQVSFSAKLWNPEAVISVCG